MSIVRNPVALITSFLWIGFVSAISFMEAWLKFRAEGITLPLGLGVGQLVFAALNRVEWVFAIVILLSQLYKLTAIRWKTFLFYLFPLLFLILQTSWLLPALDQRATLIINGGQPPASYLHFYYVGMEVLKVVCLSIFGCSLFTLKEE
jgi:uncharacterized membrane protein (DUF485 family)